MAKFGAKSLARLATCHPDIQRVMNRAIEITDFSVLCGFRDEKAQNEAVAQGHSRVHWPHGRHNKQPSEAVDVAPYPIDWENLKRFHYMAGVIMACAKEEGVELEWGGDWRSFKDYPHFQLRRTNGD